MATAAQRAIIRRHYGLKRKLSVSEADKEMESLKRKADAGTLCDLAQTLASALNIKPQNPKNDFFHSSHNSSKKPLAPIRAARYT